MAGTTVEDADNVHTALIQAFARNDFSIDRSDANAVMGIPKQIAIKSILETKFGELKSKFELITKIHNSFISEMMRFYKDDVSVRPKLNAEQTFSALKNHGIKVALDTGFTRNIADVILNRFKWQEEGLIDLSIATDEVEQGRPHPDMIYRAMQVLGVTFANEVAKVGDTIFDLQEGNAADCKFVIGITTGAYTRKELMHERHTHLIDDLLDVVDIVCP